MVPLQYGAVFKGFLMDRVRMLFNSRFASIRPQRIAVVFRSQPERLLALRFRLEPPFIVLLRHGQTASNRKSWHTKLSPVADRRYAAAVMATNSLFAPRSHASYPSTHWFGDLF